MDIQNPDPEIAINYLIDSLHATADTAVPVKKTKPIKAPWNPTISGAKQASKTAHAQWKAAWSPSEHPLAEQRAVAGRHLRQAQRQQAAKERQNSMDRLMKAHEYDDKLFYSIIRSQRNNKSLLTTELIYNDCLFVDNLIEPWEKHFEDLATPSYTKWFTDERQSQASENVKNITSLEKGSSLPIEITTQEVVNAINTIFNTRKIPTSLKEGLLHPIHKKGKPKNIPGNYRGITITPIVHKMVHRRKAITGLRKCQEHNLPGERIKSPDRDNNSGSCKRHQLHEKWKSKGRSRPDRGTSEDSPLHSRRKLSGHYYNPHRTQNGSPTKGNHRPQKMSRT